MDLAEQWAIPGAKRHGDFLMTEREKQLALRHIEDRIRLAADNGLPETAQSWRDYYLNVQARPAAEMILARDLGQESFGG
jgi:hypothetical protein